MGILDNAKQVAKAVEEIHNLELYQRVLALHSDIIELVDQNNRLRDENAQLQKNNEIRGSLKHDGERYWMLDGAQREGPFCATCWDIDAKLVRMRSYETMGTRSTNYTCDYCSYHRGKRSS